jgi:mycoredoxin-dependent peroxiredoxin
MRGFQQANAELESLGARVAGVSADTFAAQGAFAESNEITFPLLSDWPDLATIEKFGVRREGAQVAQRMTYIFDAEGVLRNVIDDQRDMNAHPQGALEAVKALSAG